MTVKELRAKLFEIENQDQEVTAELLNKLNDGEYGNSSKINIELTRIEVCDLLLATFSSHQNTEGRAKKWMQLHDKIEKQLKETDKEHGWA